MPKEIPNTPTSIFGSLHSDVFRLFSGKLRWFYADLLEYLNEELFNEGGNVARTVVLDTIRSHLERVTLGGDADQGSDLDSEFLNSADKNVQAQIAYTRLHATGWLVEHRDHYRRSVDLDPNARLLLDFLIDVKAGRLRSYGGEVLQVLTLLEAARLEPQIKSEVIRNAARSSRSFLNHLRSVGSAMRKAADAIQGERELGPLFRRFFDEFVARHLIEDFKRLHTQTNPFRFRVRILEVAAEIEMDDLLLRLLAGGYVREGRALDEEQGIETVVSELRQIQRVFQDLDTYLDIIEETSSRVERRIRNIVRYMDRIAETRTEKLAQAFRMLAQAPLASDGFVELPTRRLLPGNLPRGGMHLFQAAAKRQPVGPRPIRRPIADPADTAYEAALVAYRLRRVVTPRRMEEYLARAMGDRHEMQAADLPVATLDDFFVFERLRAVEHFEGGTLSSRYRAREADGMLDNGWLICPNFIITRVTGKTNVA